MNVLSFFCGAGGMDLGFIQEGFEVVMAWDFDKYAVESYRHNIGDHVLQRDIKEMTGEEVPHADGWLFGFPCQDLSVAGHMKGMIKGETRSGLFYEVMRLLEEVDEKPKFILAENVKGLKKYLPALDEEYEKAGYHMYHVIYNSKYQGVPQNRERYFVLGIRKDLALSFTFQEQDKSSVPKLLSVLEESVDDKFYLNKPIEVMLSEKEGLQIVANTNPSGKGMGGNVYDSKGLAPTVSTNKGEGSRVLVREATKKGYAEASIGDSVNISHPNSKTRRGRVGKQVAQTILTGQEQVVVEPKVKVIGMVDMKGQETVRRIYDKEGLSPTITTMEGGHRQPKVFEEFRIRKLTPRECARLQGFPDTYEQIVSNTQFYKQMGNAVTVNVAAFVAKQIKEAFKK